MKRAAATPDTPPAAEADPFEGLKPGRVVYYHPKAHEARNAAPGPWAAMVSAVSAEFAGQVTLHVFMPVPAPVSDGDPVCRLREVPYSAEKAEGHWSWMFDGQATRYQPDRTA